MVLEVVGVLLWLLEVRLLEGRHVVLMHLVGCLADCTHQVKDIVGIRCFVLGLKGAGVEVREAQGNGLCWVMSWLGGWWSLRVLKGSLVVLAQNLDVWNLLSGNLE